MLKIFYKIQNYLLILYLKLIVFETAINGYNLRVSSPQDPNETEGLTDTEIIIPHFPTNFRELYEYRAEQKEKIRNKMSEEILSGVGENQKMKFGMHLYRGFVFGTTATIPGKK